MLLSKNADGTFSVPQGDESPVKLSPWHYVHNITPMSDGTAVKTVLIDSPVTESEKYTMCPLRSSFYHLPSEHYLKAGKCQEILYWDSQNKFCGCCGSPMRMDTDISKKCTNCGKELWPLLATAVIVLIRKKPTTPDEKEEILLVRAKNFRKDYYGLVAGFVETGETLEEAVHREVLEETGLKIHNLRYFDSQPWPYPCGLMVGYTADYLSGDIHIQQEELKNAGWFNHDNMPSIPEKMSIARKLIDTYLNIG